MNVIERKLSFPVNNEDEAAMLALDIALQGAAAGILAIPEVPTEHGNDCKSLTMVFLLDERQAAFFDEMQALMAQLGPILDQLGPLLAQEPINFTTN